LDDAVNRRCRLHVHGLGGLFPGLAVALALFSAPFGAAFAEDPEPKAAAKAPTAGAVADAIDRQPYRIELHLAFDPSARMDQARSDAFMKQWLALVRRFVGPPWMITVATKPNSLASGNLETLEAEACKGFDSAFDKIWLVKISAARPASGLAFTGREYDTATRRLEPLQEHRTFVLAEAPRDMLRFSLQLFNPTALISGQEGGRALLLVRGGSIGPASELGRVVSKGTVFVPLRLVTMNDRSIAVRRIAFTYLQTQEVAGAVARCAIVSPLHDPLSQRVAMPNTLVALGVKPGSQKLRLRFLNRPDMSPAAGYTLFARAVPDGLPQELGMTDRTGRIALKSGFADGLVILRLVAGSSEPLVEFPVMPGESGDQRDIDFEPLSLTVGYQVELDALRDEVIDLVAQRSRLEKRMEARLQGEDLDGLQEGLKEYQLLSPRELYADRLAKLQNRATKQQAESKKPVLSKNLRARFSELQALIDRYLNNEAFQSYSEALERKQSERSGGAQAKKGAKGKGPPAQPLAEEKPPEAPKPNEPAAETPPF
jgi:hypothetical protein